MKLRWSPEAAENLSEISQYLELHHPTYAESTVRELFDAISSLEQMPYRGRPGKTPFTRELVFPRLPYIAVYAIKDDIVQVVSIRHTSRKPIIH
jgi:toxin ParE1/3/4